MEKRNHQTAITMSINQIDEIKNCISRYLSVREHSKLELFEKLFKKEFSQKEIEVCILDYEVKGLQSDERFAELYVKSKYDGQRGPLLIKASLKRNGISKDIIDSVLLSYSNKDWEKSAVIALKKKVLPKKISTDKGKIQKQQKFLESRGFGYNIIRSAIDKFWKS